MKKVKKRNKSIKYIYNDLYYANIWFFKDWDRQDFKSHLSKKYFYNNFNTKGTPAGSVIELDLADKHGNPGLAYCLWLESDYDNVILAHECLHLTIRIMDHAGIKLSYDSEEAFTYLLSWIIEKVEQFK